MNNDSNKTVSADAPDNYENALPNIEIIQPSASAPNRNAMVSFVVSILNLCALWVIPIVGVGLSAVALVSGLKARKEMRVSHASGGRLAITGLICGCLSLLLSVVVCPFVWFFLIAVTMSH